MGNRVLLISVNRCLTPDAVFPLGVSHLNSALRRAGHETRWLDCLVDNQPLASVLSEYQPHYVGVSVRNIDDVLIRKRQTYYDQVGDICATIRKTNPCPVILGGSGFSIFPERLLAQTGADYGIQGEGEAGLLALMTALNRGGDLSGVPGLVFRRGDRIVSNPQRAATVTEALTAMDRPPHLVAHYLQNCSMLNLQTQRGCAHSCCYCTYPVIEGRAHRRRPPETVAEEMAQLEAQGVKYVFVVDSVFNSSARHVAETCEAIIRRKTKLRWGCFARPQGLTPELMSLMVRAGLSHIEFGSDSFCDCVLETYGKRLTFDDILHSSALAREHQVDYCHFLICGGPGETPETLQATFENSKRLNDAVIMACVGMRIYPGTALFEQSLREGRISPETDLLTPTYYLAADMTAEDVFATLEQFAAKSPNWIVGDPTPGYTRLVERLRARGVAGPLWSYFSVVQRLWRPAATSANA
jgi:radical SAM superfamily enzyme YgiQ (UPF0313 family)